MGLMDKFKNLFTDEEIIEEEQETEPIEIKEVKKEEVQKLPTFMREKIEQEEQQKEESSSTINSDNETTEKPKEEMEIPEIQSLEEKNTFKFPIDFSENDFIETRSRESIHHNKKEPKIAPEKKEPVKKVAEIYKEHKPKKEEENKFRATPIISPIYGILDKNYTPMDMEKSEGENLEKKRHSKNVDFDSVRKKAYGNLTDAIKENLMCENCEYLKEAKECQEAKKTKEILKQQKEYDSDLIEENNQNLSSDITLDEATENYFDYGVEYEKSPSKPSEQIKIVNSEEKRPPKKEIPPVKSSINLLSTLKKSMGETEEPIIPKKETKEKNLELTDDLFNLIDSMYDERNDS